VLDGTEERLWSFNPGEVTAIFEQFELGVAMLLSSIDFGDDPLRWLRAANPMGADLPERRAGV
jgi:hypothetical protein